MLIGRVLTILGRISTLPVRYTVACVHVHVVVMVCVLSGVVAAAIRVLLQPDQWELLCHCVRLARVPVCRVQHRGIR